MKRIVNLTFVLALVLCLATTAFAVVSADMFNPAEATEVTVSAGDYANVTVLAGGFDLLVTGEGDFTVKYSGNDYAAVNGKAVIPNIQGSRFSPVTVKITNNSTEKVTYTMIGQFPLGDMNNPAALEFGANAARIEAGSTNYYISWTAPASGVLTVTMPTDMDWMFTYSNFGPDIEDYMDDVYGSELYSTDEDVNPIVIEVKAGDILQLQINTYDPENVWNTPAGTISYTADFQVVHTNVQHVEAVDPGCHYKGNIEYWFCPDCEQFWQDEALTQVTNSKNVVLPALGSDNLIHFEAVDPGCHYKGNIEYWFCPDCEQFWQDEALTQLTNSKNVVLPALGSDNLEHHEAVAAGCETNGSIEYWHCPDCEQFWQDEALTQLTNSKRVIVPAAGGHNYVDGVCTVCGDNPNTGDAGIVTVAATMLVSAMSTVALVSKKKEF